MCIKLVRFHDNYVTLCVSLSLSLCLLNGAIEEICKEQRLILLKKMIQVPKRWVPQVFVMLYTSKQNFKEQKCSVYEVLQTERIVNMKFDYGDYLLYGYLLESWTDSYTCV